MIPKNGFRPMKSWNRHMDSKVWQKVWTQNRLSCCICRWSSIFSGRSQIFHW